MLSLSSAEYNSARTSRVVRGFMNTESHDEYRMASGVLLPSGKVRVGVVPLPSVPQSDKEYERNHARIETDYVSFRAEEGYYRNYNIQREVDCQPLGLSAVPNYHTPQRRHGLKGISASGREAVKESAYVLERRYGRRLGFYTLTCPYTDEESIYSYNKDIRYILRLYFQELKREYKRMGVPFSYVSVLEIQPERYTRDGIPVLHIHYLAPCYVPGTWSWVVAADAIRNLWGRVLEGVLGKRADMGASVDASVVRSSAVGYIAKYMSKGGSELDVLAQTCPDQLPSQWWSTSRNVRNAVKNITVRLPDAIAYHYVCGGGKDPEELLYLTYSRDIFIEWGGSPRFVGISGQLCKEGCNALQDWKGKLSEI
jgi:hypothetical protein